MRIGLYTYKTCLRVYFYLTAKAYVKTFLGTALYRIVALRVVIYLARFIGVGKAM
jgi:hypothetical protein